MSDTKTKPITDPKRLRPFGQNVELCAEIKGLKLEVVAKEAKIPLSLLTSFLNGRGVLMPDVVGRLASVFGLSTLQLIGTKGPLETRTGIFKRLFDLEKSFEVPHEDFDRSLVRGGKSFQWPIGVRKGDDDDGAEEAADESSDESETNATAPEAQQSEPSEAPTEVLEALPAHAESDRDEAIKELTRRQRYDAEIHWGRSSYCGKYKGRTYNLKENVVRRSVSRRLKEIKGDLTSAQLAAKIGKSRSWISNLSQGAGDLDRSHLEQLAAICQTTVVFLLTGKNPAEEVRDQ